MRTWSGCSPGPASDADPQYEAVVPDGFDESWPADQQLPADVQQVLTEGGWAVDPVAVRAAWGEVLRTPTTLGQFLAAHGPEPGASALLRKLLYLGLVRGGVAGSTDLVGQVPELLDFQHLAELAAWVHQQPDPVAREHASGLLADDLRLFSPLPAAARVALADGRRAAGVRLAGLGHRAAHQPAVDRCRMGAAAARAGGQPGRHRRPDRGGPAAAAAVAGPGPALHQRAAAGHLGSRELAVGGWLADPASPGHPAGGAAASARADREPGADARRRRAVPGGPAAHRAARGQGGMDDAAAVRAAAERQRVHPRGLRTWDIPAETAGAYLNALRMAGLVWADPEAERLGLPLAFACCWPLRGDFPGEHGTAGLDRPAAGRPAGQRGAEPGPGGRGRASLGDAGQRPLPPLIADELPSRLIQGTASDPAAYLKLQDALLIWHHLLARGLLADSQQIDLHLKMNLSMTLHTPTVERHLRALLQAGLVREVWSADGSLAYQGVVPDGLAQPHRVAFRDWLAGRPDSPGEDQAGGPAGAGRPAPPPPLPPLPAVTAARLAAVGHRAGAGGGGMERGAARRRPHRRGATEGQWPRLR